MWPSPCCGSYAGTGSTIGARSLSTSSAIRTPTVTSAVGSTRSGGTPVPKWRSANPAYASPIAPPDRTNAG